MRRGIAAVLALTVLAGGARADDKKTDAEKIRGAWKVVSAKETRGDDPNADVPEYKDSVWTFGEKEFTVTRGKTETKLAYRLDPAKKPKEIDLGKNLAGKNDQRPFEGIYELDGDKLTVCYTVFNARPTDFSMGRGIASIKRLVMLKREPAAKRDGKPAPDPLAELRGTWTLVSYRVDGATLRGADGASTFTVEEDRWTSSWRKDGGGAQVEQGEVRVIDAAGRSKVADLVHTFGLYKGTTTRVFYRVEGDFLCYTSIVAPDELSADGRVVASTLTWKRKRDAR